MIVCTGVYSRKAGKQAWLLLIDYKLRRVEMESTCHKHLARVSDLSAAGKEGMRPTSVQAV